MKKISRTKIRVEFEDCDSMGVVYHPNYLRFVERARIEYLRDHGISYCVFMESGHGLVISDIKAHYWRPTKFEDEIYVYSRQIEFNDKRLVLEQFIVREVLAHEQEMMPVEKIKGRIFTATLEMVSVNLKTLRSAPLPESIAEKLRPLTVTID